MTPENNHHLPLNIGLSLSGGGYRAAGFHLGLLTYLNRVNLLSKVTMLSTVSGGTFTGAKYVLSLVEKQSFNNFYQEYYQFLNNTNLIELALDKLGQQKSETPSGRMDLITAVSQVYAETFLQNSQGQPYRLRDIFDKGIPLKEIVFNATEFRYGLAFRFQCISTSEGKFGNGRISIPKSVAADIRIADIVAASSCFPGGFEPIAFPDDFNWSSADNFEQVRTIIHRKYPKSLALMDGGIYDNQGIESVHLADKRNSYSLDLLIISDVDNSPASLYDFPNRIESKFGGISLNTVDVLSKIWIACSLLTIIAIAVKILENLWKQQFNWWDIFLYAIPFILATATTVIIFWARSFIKNKLLSQVPKVGEFSWQSLKKLTLDQVINGIVLRLSSLQVMAGSVFMKRIRQMGLTAIYKLDNGKQRKKIIANFISDLKTGKTLAKLPPEVLPPSPELLAKIDAAANMSTTLWFTEDNQLENLIICGQATICYQLMVYLMRTYQANDTNDPIVKSLWNQLVSDWNTLVTNPNILNT
jgi:predicted acylesterase/phospholipase RssA